MLRGELTLGTDNGTAYTSRAFRGRLGEHKITHRRGGYRDPESQAFIESWFSKLKQRCVWREEFETLDEARTKIGAYIDGYHHRPHSGLAYRTPREVAADLERSRRPVNPSGLSDNADRVHATYGPANARSSHRTVVSASVRPASTSASLIGTGPLASKGSRKPSLARRWR